MKTMTCKQLGGACDKQFQADTFEEIVELSKAHGMQMFQTQDAEHLQAMAKIQQMMQQPQAMQEWFQSKKDEFDALPSD
ncbi:hypothetical protein QX776_00205 [Alteromonadaceae bacterium BrNp21-10]|nr:hypothetical protein [Alteromonadaceae bacterium BrNp21-10]